MFTPRRLDSSNFFTRLGLPMQGVTDEMVREAYRTITLLCRNGAHPQEEENLWQDRTQGSGFSLTYYVLHSLES